MNVPFLNVQLPITGCIRNDNSVLEIIRAVRPQWKTKSIQFELYTAGITNKIFSAFVDSSDKLIFRVFGRNTEHFIDREKELEAMEKLYKNHLAAPLYARFINGIVCGYLPGSTISIDDLKNPHIQKKICSTIAAYHNIDGVPIRNDKNLFPFRKIRDFIGNIGDRASSEQIDFINELPNHLEEIQSLVLPLEEEITFCHNDLLVHNILFDPISEQVRFLDYEYADYNYAIFDLANHFCEYAGVENPDYSRCPNERYRREFLRMYLEERFGKVDDNRLNQLTERCVLFQALAHLLWSSWSIVQSQNSTLDFDYISYARLRYDQYLKLMKELKSSNKETIKTKDC